MKTMTVANREVHILREGEGACGPLFLLGVFAGEEEYVESIFSAVKEMAPGASFTLAAFETQNWDLDFSPWEAPGAMPGEAFGGGGPATLEWLSEALNGDLKGFKGDDGIFICGYSLAGLFALWSVYASDLFDGCACCSGSLWFAGWTPFAASHALTRPGAVYLSLGGKEEKSKNPVMATIGDATRLQAKLLSRDPNVRCHTLVMNPGGHFASTDKRVAKGIAWVMENWGK